MHQETQKKGKAQGQGCHDETKTKHTTIIANPQKASSQSQ